MRTHTDRRTPLRQHARRPLVGAQPPSWSLRVIHGAAHNRVAENKLPGHIRLTDKVDADQLVQGSQRPGFGHAGHFCGELHIEWLGHHGGGLQQPPRRRRQVVQLLCEGRSHGRGNGGLPECGLGRFVGRVRFHAAA